MICLSIVRTRVVVYGYVIGNVIIVEGSLM